MKPITTDKSGESAIYGGRHKKQYYAGSSTLMKRNLSKCRRRMEKIKKHEL